MLRKVGGRQPNQQMQFNFVASHFIPQIIYHMGWINLLVTGVEKRQQQ